ncbi:MAG: hypothetical protein COA80_00710 [Leeuwenhoekiella sp.]|nr:MAG: hypothetical protein COA80_00710 [Leeuwenhoekiella sp.]
MDLDVRKYKFIKELLRVESDDVMDKLERILGQERDYAEELSPEHKAELDRRLKSYENNPQDFLNWEEVKKDW